MFENSFNLKGSVSKNRIEEYKNRDNFFKYKNKINVINAFGTKLETADDNELNALTYLLQKKVSNRKPNDIDYLNELAFALVREASWRILGLRHYDVQLLGGLILNDGKIGELRTGEGKTLVATLPAYSNSLNKKGVHIITVNEYLATRDQRTMGKIYQYLGINTGLIQEDMKTFERKQNYRAEITYVTNNELGFDYLRDNTTLDNNNVVLRSLNYAIIDEIDSVLIDEAQTPLIISTAREITFRKYLMADLIITYLEVNKHFVINEKDRTIVLTDQGNIKVEQILEIKNLYDIYDSWVLYVVNALKAKMLFFKNIHYLVTDNQVKIIDEFTGRIMKNRRWNDGLHQAIEVKENVPIGNLSKTIASVTYQNLFALYSKIAGMTGTAKSAELEFGRTYGLIVDEVPTNVESRRIDLPDIFYKDQFSKWNAIVEACRKISQTGQPILVGTTTVEKSELLAELLKEYKLSFQLLNAKPENQRRESEIISKAGKKNVITVATNMAGRGTDIILGGSDTYGKQKEVYETLIYQKYNTTMFPLLTNRIKYKSHPFLSMMDSMVRNYSYLLRFPDLALLRIILENEQNQAYIKLYNLISNFLNDTVKSSNSSQLYYERNFVKSKGGLYVLGSERNDSKRIDDQLRGRCGRQGEPGTSQFFLSLDDRMLRLFSTSNTKNLIENQLKSNVPIQSSIFIKSLDLAQESVEDRAYQKRKFIATYDQIIDQKRNLIYSERQKNLNKTSLFSQTLTYREQIGLKLIRKSQTKGFRKAFRNVRSINGRFQPITVALAAQVTKNVNLVTLKRIVFRSEWIYYRLKNYTLDCKFLGLFGAYERQFNLMFIDITWNEFLTRTQLLIDTIGLRNYGQRNPLYDYEKEVKAIFKQKMKIVRMLNVYNNCRIVKRL
mmetsp:Transcript_25843/g.39590  ORF Transcript_25843/g.39590 Transcript_25843/m.39590 type:complete len:896 (+) Transcript_25843:1554-4241(+)